METQNKDDQSPDGLISSRAQTLNVGILTIQVGGEMEICVWWWGVR